MIIPLQWVLMITVMIDYLVLRSSLTVMIAVLDLGGGLGRLICYGMAQYLIPKSHRPVSDVFSDTKQSPNQKIIENENENALRR